MAVWALKIEHIAVSKYDSSAVNKVNMQGISDCTMNTGILHDQEFLSAGSHSPKLRNWLLLALISLQQ